MKIEQIMVTNVISVSPRTKLIEAYRTSQAYRIRHFPVVDGDQLVGIVSDRDLRDAHPSLLTESDSEAYYLKEIREIMVRNVITIHPLDFVEDAAKLLYQYRIGCLPVVSDDRLVGIISERDILHTLLGMMGVQEPSSRVEIEVPDQSGMLANVADLLRARKINVSSVMVFRGPAKGKKTLVFRLATMDPRRFVQDVKTLGYHVVTPSNGEVEL